MAQYRPTHKRALEAAIFGWNVFSLNTNNLTYQGGRYEPSSLVTDDLHAQWHCCPTKSWNLQQRPFLKSRNLNGPLSNLKRLKRRRRRRTLLKSSRRSCNKNGLSRVSSSLDRDPSNFEKCPGDSKTSCSGWKFLNSHLKVLLKSQEIKPSFYGWAT